jgi:hypothetical protein
VITIKLLSKTIVNGTARSAGEVVTVTDELADELVREGSAEVREPPGPRETTARHDDRKETA